MSDIPFKVVTRIDQRFSCPKMAVVEPKGKQLRTKDVALGEPKVPDGSLKVRLNAKTIVTITPTKTRTVKDKLEDWRKNYPKLEVLGPA